MALGMLQDHYLGLELLGHGWGLLHGSADVAAANVLLGDAAHVASDVVSGEGLSNLLVMHLDGLDLTGYTGGLEDDLVVLPHDAGLDTPDGHCSYAGDGVDILHRHTQRQVGRLLRAP